MVQGVAGGHIYAMTPASPVRHWIGRCSGGFFPTGGPTDGSWWVCC